MEEGGISIENPFAVFRLYHFARIKEPLNNDCSRRALDAELTFANTLIADRALIRSIPPIGKLIFAHLGRCLPQMGTPPPPSPD